MGGEVGVRVDPGEVITTLDLMVDPHPDYITIKNYATGSVLEAWDFSMGPTKFFLYNAPSKISVEVKKQGYLSSTAILSLVLGEVNTQPFTLQQADYVSLLVYTYTPGVYLSSIEVERYQSGGVKIPSYDETSSTKSWKLSPGVEYELVGRDSGGLIAVVIYIPAHVAGERVTITLADYIGGAHLSFDYFDKDYHPVVGREIVVKREGVEVARKNTNGSGNALIELLAKTSYTWSVDTYSGDAITGEGASTTTVNVNPDAGKGGGGLMGSLTVHIVDADGNNAEGVTVTAVGAFTYTYITAPNGMAYFNDKFPPLTGVTVTAQKGSLKVEKSVSFGALGGTIDMDLVLPKGDNGGGGGGGGGGDEELPAWVIPAAAIGGAILLIALLRRDSSPVVMV